MTTLAARAAVSPAGRTAHGALPLRLLAESDRQVPFSHAKMLLREAASAIERLEAGLGKVTAELEEERAARQRLEAGRLQS